MSESIKIEVEGLVYLDIDELIPFQGDLKDLTETNYLKLRQDILSLGFSFVFHAWRNIGKCYVLDGHQRLRVLLKMRASGIEIPAMPVVLVSAKDYKEAKRKVLAGASQFGTVTEQGLYEFIGEGGLDWRDVVQEFRFPEVNFDTFVASHYAEVIPTEDEEPEEKKKPEKKSKTFECPECGHEFRKSED